MRRKSCATSGPALLLTVAGALAQTDAEPGPRAALEVRVAPPDAVFLNDSGRRTGHRDLMLQNVALVNVGSGEATLDAMEIVASRQGRPVVTNAIDLGAYEPVWQQRQRYYTSPGVRESQDSICLFSHLLDEHETLSPSRTLAPGSAMLVTKHVLTFVSWQTPDALEVRVRGRDAAGGSVEASARLRVGRPRLQNEYHLPVSGRWYISSSSSLNSHHRIRPAHEFAIDFLRIGAGGASHRGDGTEPEDYYAYGCPVYAVADGEVVRAVGDVPDTELPRKGESRSDFAQRVLDPMWANDPTGRIASGNLIVIEHAGGEHSTYVHLEPESLRVGVGDTVFRGQVIAEVGFSGDAFEPHLHFQVNRGPDAQYSPALPVTFANVRPVGFASTIDTEPRRLFMAGEFVETFGDLESEGEEPGYERAPSKAGGGGRKDTGADDRDGSDERGGVTDGSLDRLTDALQGTLEQLRARHRFPGATAAVALADGRCVSVATGFADAEADEPMRPDHRMLAGSIGKTFVAALAVKLHLEGRLDLDARIEEWFGEEPWFERLPNHAEITLRALLNHGAGLPNHAWYPDVVEAVKATFDPQVDWAPPHAELVAFVLDEEPLFPAGSGFEYTDTGFILAGWILELASGRDYYELLQAELLDRLELVDTVPADTRAIPGLAAGYMGASDTIRFPEKVAEIGELLYDPTFEWTGGGLASTSADLARWGRRLYGGTAIVGEYLPEILESTGDRPPIDDIPAIGPYRYGLGVYLADSPLGPLVGHGGVMFGYSSRMRYFVDHGFAVAVQVNRFLFGDDMQAYLLALGETAVAHLEQ